MKYPFKRNKIVQPMNLSKNKLRWFEEAIGGSVNHQRRLIRSLFKGLKAEQDWALAVELEKCWHTGIMECRYLEEDVIAKLAKLGHPNDSYKIDLSYDLSYYGGKPEEEKEKL